MPVVAVLFLHSLKYPSKEQSKTVLCCSGKGIHLLTRSCDTRAGCAEPRTKQDTSPANSSKQLDEKSETVIHSKNTHIKETIRSTLYRQLSNKTENSTAEEELQWRIKWLWNISISWLGYILKYNTEISFVFLRRMHSLSCFYITKFFVLEILYKFFSSLFLFLMAP